MPNYTEIEIERNQELADIQYEMEEELEKLRIKYDLYDRLSIAFSWIAVAFIAIVYLMVILSDLHKFFFMKRMKIKKTVHPRTKEKHNNKIQPLDCKNKDHEMKTRENKRQKVDYIEKRKKLLQDCNAKLKSRKEQYLADNFI